MDNELREAIGGALLAQLGQVSSKVTGRRNWEIKTYDDMAYCGGFGQMVRNGLLGWHYLREMAEHGITFRAFTYKKDFQAAIEQYKKAGYKIIMIEA